MKYSMVLLTLLIPTGDAVADTIYVDDSNPVCPGDGSAGNPFCDIPAAIAAASEGDTVLIAPGTYPGGIQFTKGLTLRGSGPRLTRIVADAGQTGVLVVPPPFGPELVIEGLRIDGPPNGLINSTYGLFVGAHLIPGPAFHVRDVEVHGFSSGLSLSPALESFAVVEDCLVVDAAKDGVLAAGFGDLEIRRCTIVGSGERAIDASAVLNSLSVRDSIIAESAYWAVEFDAPTQVDLSYVIEHNNNLANPSFAPNAGPFIEHIVRGVVTWQDFVPGPGPVFSVDPQFLHTPGGDFQLTVNSPAVDAGSPAATAGPDNYDVRGFGHPRLVDGDFDGQSAIDIGAFEYGGLVVAAEQPVHQPVLAFASGPPNGQHAILVGGLGTTAVPAASAGDLFLDPATVFLLFVGPLNGAGQANVPLGTPPPSLIGLDIPLQGVTATAIGSDVRLTSLAITRLVP